MTVAEGTEMAKVQKNFLIDEDLAKLLDKVIECTGSNFTKVATAALLEFLFRGYANPEEGASAPSPDVWWFRMAIQLERGDLRVGDLPTAILEDLITAKQRWIESVEQDNPDPAGRLARNLDQSRRQLVLAKKMRHNWNNALERADTPLDAMLDRLSFSMKP